MTTRGRRRIFITGASGVLGSTIIFMLRGKYETSFCYHRHPVSFQGTKGFHLDLTNREETLRQVIGLHPEVIVHCAALTDVDYCEDHYKEARIVNAEATRTLAEIADRVRAKLIYISTEAVYEGAKGNYSEEDPPKPVNRYGETKLEGEQAVSSGKGDWFIARTGFESWRPNGNFGKRSFFGWLIEKLESGRPFPVFHDRHFTPLSVYNLVSILNEVIDRDIRGLFNVEGIERCSYVDFAKKVAQAFGLDGSLIRAVSLEVYPAKVKRPRDTSLNVNRLRRVIQTQILDVTETIQELKSFRDSGRLELLRRELATGTHPVPSRN